MNKSGELGLTEMNGTRESAFKMKAVLFDGDDTLWSTQPLYDESKQQYADMMLKEGFTRRQSLDVVSTVDLENVAKYGFHRKRFPTSLIQAYTFLAESVGRSPKRELIVRLKKLGNSVFAKTPELAPGVNDFLESLRGKLRRILVTAGDPIVQRTKVEKLHIADYFDAVYVPRLKTEKELRRILRREGVRTNEAVLVGNSARSDVLPGLAAGMHVIWLRGAGWEYDRARVRSRRVLKVNGIGELKRVLNELLVRSAKQ